MKQPLIPCADFPENTHASFTSGSKIEQPYDAYSWNHVVHEPSQEPAVIRRAGQADLPVLIDLLHWLSIDEPPMTLEQAENVWHQIAGSPIMSVWIVERGGKAVGTYTLAILPTLCHVGTPTALVESVVVAPEQRGQQLGELMMRHACTQAAAAGCY